MLKRCLAVGTVMWCVGAACPAGETTWDRNAKWLQQQIEACQQGAGELPCRSFVPRALNQLFGIDEFCQSEACLQTHEVAAEIGKGGHWTSLGRASDQKVLTQAQEMATGGLPVIAVQAASSQGLVAIIMPGGPFPSQRWSRNVPLAVGTRADKPLDSVYARSLSFLFSEPEKVTLYAYK